MTALPKVEGRSSYQQFMDEYDGLQRELMITKDEFKSTQEQLIQTTNMVELMRAENARLREELRQERARTNTWLGYVMSISGRLAAIRSSIDSAEGIAREAAKAAAERGLDDEINEAEEDAEQLTKVVAEQPTRVPEPRRQKMPNAFS